MYGQFTEDNKSKFGHMYSSVQWFTALDSLIYSAVDVLLQRTTFVQEHLSTLVNYQLMYKRRGVSTKLKWEATLATLIEVIANPTIENYKQLYLDRGYSIYLLSEFLRLSQGYTQLNVSGFRLAFHLDLCYYIKTLNATTDDLYGVIQHVDYTYKNIVELRNMLLSYYILYIEKTANYDAKNAKFITDVEEIKQNYFLAFNKAVDHFNVDKGAFKSYLDVWITKYRNHHSNYYGTAFKVPSGSGIYSMSEELDIEKVDSEVFTSNCIDSVNTENTMDFYRRLARLVDPEGYSFESLGLTKEETNETN